MPRRRATRRPRRRVAKKRNYRTRRRGLTTSQTAKIVETIEFNNIAPNYVQGLVFNLNQFERARTIATNFRWMKATKVTWSIEPQFNTYQSEPGGSTVPYVYTVMNRTQDSSFMTLSDLLSQGARPIKLVNLKKMRDSITENIGHLSAETLGWIAVILVHLATIPTLVAVLTGLTEKLPPVDMVALMWLGLFTFFVRSVIAKDLLNMITIGFGFFVQAMLMALIIFK